MAFVVIGRDETRNIAGVPVISEGPVSGEFATRAEAEKRRAELAEALPGEKFKVGEIKPGEVLEEKIIAERTGRAEQVTQEREQARLAQQALDKGLTGVTLSTAEKQALKKVPKLKVSEKESTTGKALLARIEVRKVALEKLRKGEKLSNIEQSSLERFPQTIQEFKKEEQQRISGIFETRLREAKKPAIPIGSGLLGGEVKSPISFITERKKEKRIAGKLIEKAQELEFEAQFREQDLFKKVSKTGAAVALGFAAVPIGLVTQPIEAVKGTFQQAFSFVKDPFGEGAKLRIALETRPAVTVGTIAGIFATGRAIPKAVKVAKAAKVKLSPIKVDIVAKKIKFKVARTKGGIAKQIAGVEDVRFAARIGAEEFGGIARGVGAITKKGKAGFAFEVDVIKKGARKPIKTDIAVKIAQAKPMGEIFRGVSIGEAVTKGPTKEIIQRTITPFRGKEFITDKIPKTVIQAGVILKAKRRLKLSLIELSLTEKVRTFDKPGVGTVSVFKGAEIGLGDPFIKRLVPRRKLGKRGEILVPPETQIKFEPAILTSEFFGAIRKGVRGVKLLEITEPKLLFPLFPKLERGKIKEITRETGKPLIDIKPIEDIIGKEKTILEQIPISTQEVITEMKSITKPEFASISEFATVQEQKIFPEQILKQVPSPRQIPIPTPLLPPISPLIPLVKPPKRKFAPPITDKGFDTFVREGEKRGDRFKRVAGNLPINRALSKGKRITDNFIEASFKVEPSGKKTQLLDNPFPPDLSKFRRPKGKTKLPAGTFVEKRKHRLDSSGEIRDISFFKQQAKLKKQRKKGLGVFPF